MGLLEGASPACPRNCSEWIRIHMKYCLCSVKDGASLTLGLISVLSWGVAEVPQIITNYKEKSTEGLSFAFLMTWIVGDLFNLFGCLLEPATLPTQYYMAVLYTVTTVVLAAQTVYYDHIYHRLKAGLSYKGLVQPDVDSMTKSQLNDKETGFKDDKRAHQQSTPIPVGSPAAHQFGSPSRDLYYVSARSLSRSYTPTAGSFLVHSRTPERTISSSIQEPLLGSVYSAPVSQTKSMLCLASSLVFFLCSYDFSSSPRNMFQGDSRKPTKGVVIQLGRKLLQNRGMSSLSQEGHGSSKIGSYLGWAMAAIYMGGRLPQICLNMRRGNVEGLSPFMFVFALVGNATYVASILVNSLDWSQIRPNLPWLVDAAGCVILDFFILLQFVYFRYWKPKNSEIGHGHETTS